jgi:tight adherence protein B
MILAVVALFMLAAGGVVFAFAAEGRPSQKRLSMAAKPQAVARTGRSTPENQQRRKNMAAALKDIEKQSVEQKKKEKITLRRRLDRAGLPNVTTRKFWIVSGVLSVVAGFFCFATGQSMLVIVLVPFGIGFGLPRWVLSFLCKRREKKFTDGFATAVDVIIRSVKSGLPTNEALRIVSRECPDPVGGEFQRLVEGMKVGVTLEQGLKKMYENMPTAEVSFFSIVMTVQQKSGGNLSEALGNLSGVLRDRKRLIGKIKAMSSEAKASAMIIGALPPGVMGIVYLTTPDYIALLFTERAGNLMLLGCAIWMSVGIFVMKKMINFSL